MHRKIAVVLLLTLLCATGLIAPESGLATRYTVSQCGWHVGHDATWADTSADKFTRSSFCQPPPPANSFDGVHLISETKGSANFVGGTRYARWRWQAPPGTGIVTIHGQRWQYLRDGFRHRIGSVAANGAFDPFLDLTETNPDKRDFSQSFSPSAAAVESRLLCAKPDDKVCSTEDRSLVGVRGLTITINDSQNPSASVSGSLTGSAWLHGSRALRFSSTDAGSGLRYSQTLIDGSVRAQTEHSCNKEMIAGEWRGTRMQPCPASAGGYHSVNTAGLSDGPHRLQQCAVDFAGNRSCPVDRTIRTDNTAPAAPRQLGVAGGNEWRRKNGFDLLWQSPDQGVAAPIVVSQYQVTGAGRYDSGPVSMFGSGLLRHLLVPAAGEYRVSVWLIDAAGNANPAAHAETTVRLDDVPPSAYFLEPESDHPEHLRVPVSDSHSGVAGGTISYRRQGSGSWQRLATEYVPGSRVLEADFPSGDVSPGTYEFEARVLDRAGNGFVTGRRGNGSPMTLRAPLRDTTSLTARLRWKRRSGLALKIPYGKTALVSGRLARHGGQALAGQQVRVSQVQAFGALAEDSTISATTDRDGYFSAALTPGATRRVSVGFGGSALLDAANAGPLELRVMGSLSLRAKPRKLKTGQKLRLRGKVKSGWARRPERGSLVAIQYLEKASRKWRPVLVTRAGPLGNFHAGYRFRYITGKARIRLRAVLMPSQFFPFDSAASKTIKVGVQG
ncbi:MAG: hypothetical protein IPK93_03020 [Solirubrobacterales bacterium]|nr:hypothetical protein [Solirubrobacterales bacterium]